jgi:hypothetical protein
MEVFFGFKTAGSKGWFAALSSGAARLAIPVPTGVSAS